MKGFGGERRSKDVRKPHEHEARQQLESRVDGLDARREQLEPEQQLDPEGQQLELSRVGRGEGRPPATAPPGAPRWAS